MKEKKSISQDLLHGKMVWGGEEVQDSREAPQKQAL